MRGAKGANKTHSFISTARGAADIGISNHAYLVRAVKLGIKPAIRGRLTGSGRSSHLWSTADHLRIKTVQSMRGKWKRDR